MAEQIPVIEISQLVYEIGGRRILNGIDLTIFPSEVYAVMGLSGTGKTTLLRLIAGLIQADEGSIKILGQDITTMPEAELNVLRQQLGLVFQYGALFDSLNVRENVGFRLYENARLSETEVRAAVAEKLALVGMSGTEDLLPAELSGGMQKRVGVARALMGDPQILLYDEPTSGLDPVIAANIDALIRQLCENVGVTEVVVSHDVTSVLRMADRMALLYEGTVRLQGSSEMFRNSDDPVVRQFLEGNTEGPIQVV